jgi:hypothetical protein
MSQKIRVSTNDGEEQEVDIEIAKMWGTVRHLLEGLSLSLSLSLSLPLCFALFSIRL